MCIYDKFVDLRYDRKNNIENGKINKTGRGCNALDLADRPCFIKDILAKYEEPKPPYTTLASIVKNLERKKYVKKLRDAMKTEEAYRMDSAVSEVLEGFARASGCMGWEAISGILQGNGVVFKLFPADELTIFWMSRCA